MAPTTTLRNAVQRQWIHKFILEKYYRFNLQYIPIFDILRDDLRNSAGKNI